MVCRVSLFPRNSLRLEPQYESCDGEIILNLISHYLLTLPTPRYKYLQIRTIYRRTAPRKVKATAMHPTKIGERSMGWREEPEDFLAVLVAVAVTDPDPGAAVPVDVPPAF
jgi:hypothetical protein